MAALEPRNKTYRAVFMYAGKKYGYSLDTSDREMAEALRGGVEKTLMLMGQGLVKLPDGADLIGFVRPAARSKNLRRRCPSGCTSYTRPMMLSNSPARIRGNLVHRIAETRQRHRACVSGN